MKTSLFTGCALSVALCLSACGGTSDNASSSPSEQTSSLSDTSAAFSSNAAISLSSNIGVSSSTSVTSDSNSSTVPVTSDSDGDGDGDGDGVTDNEDLCPNTSQDFSTDASGCPTSIINVAIGKSAIQTSTYPNLTADRAVDGNTSGNHPQDQDLAHNSNPIAGEWWQVDLGSKHQLFYSQWYNRSDCCTDRMDDYSIYTSLDGEQWELVSHQQTVMVRPTTVRHPVLARYVRLVQNKAVNFNFAEVQIFGEALEAPPQENTLLYAINAGGSSVLDGGIFYIGDQFYQSGTEAKTLSAIAGTDLDKLFQSERYGNFSYSLPLTVGTYDIELLVAENYWQGAGQRLFDVHIENESPTKNIDIYAAAGYRTAHTMRMNDVYVSDGNLDIRFISTVDNAKIGAIRVYGKAGNATASPPMLNTRTINAPQLELIARRAAIPGLNSQPASGRSLRIWALETHQDKIYVGFGDWGQNTGPIDIVYYDPAANTFTTERSNSPTEAIELIESINGNLYIPMIDPSGFYGPVLMIQEPNRTDWITGGTITWSAHSFDVTEFEGDLYLGTGHWDNAHSGDGDALGRVYRSSDNGRTWVKDVETTLTNRFYFIGSDSNTVVASGNGIVAAKRNGQWRQITGSTAQPITISDNMKMLMGSYFSQLQNDALVFYSNHPHPTVAKWPTFNTSLPDAWSPVELLWMAIDNSSGQKEIWVSDNFIDWTPVITVADHGNFGDIYNAITAISYHNNALYLGLSNGDLYRLRTIFQSN